MFDVDLGAVELVQIGGVAVPHSYSGPDLSCGRDDTFPLGNPLSPANGWLHPLKHADMMMDGTTAILVGVNGCTAISGYADRVGRIIRVDLTTGKATTLSRKKATCVPGFPCYNDEAPASHVSCRNYLRPGWAYVTYDYSSQASGSNTKRYSGEIVAVPIDSSGAIQRFAFTQSEHDTVIAPGIPPVTQDCGFECEPQAVPDPYGNRIIWASNWYREEGGANRGAWSQSKAYVLDATCPDGSGGCPFLETWTAMGWRVENSILSRSLTGELDLDAYRLREAPRVVNGRYRLMLRENEHELTTIDQARLAYVDHTPDVRAYAKGAKLLLARRQIPHRVTSASGTDVTGLLDGSRDGYFVGEPGETLTVELVAPGLQSQAASSGAGGEDVDPFEIDPGEKDGGGGASNPGLYSISPGETSSDAVILGTTGILVQGLDASGTWTTVRKIYPRKEFAEVLVDTLDQGPVRLVFVGRHKIRYVGRLIPASGEITPSLMDLTSATHSRFGNVRSALAGSGDATSSLAPGDSIFFEYQAPPVAAGTVRDFFLLAKGSYRSASFVAEERADVPRHFALIQNRPNPFQARTAIRFRIPSGNMVRIDILDAQGRRLETLANRFFPAGEHSVEWIPRESKSSIGPGVYFYQVRSGLFQDQKQMVLVP